MKLIINDNIVIFLDKLYLHNLENQSDKITEKELIKLINKLQNKYKIDISGYYNVYIYQDKTYGIVIELQKEQLDYLEYLSDQIQLDIETIEDTFLYKIEDFFYLNKTLLKKFDIYKKSDTLYLSPHDKLTNAETAILIENSEIIYGTKAKKIKNKSQIIKGGW